MIVGHQKIWQFLKKSAESGKLPHALLLSGQEKLGKRTLAVELAKLLLEGDIEKRQHPDFIFIEPIEKEIQISQIREVLWKLSLKPSVSLFKVAIIDQAHCLNSEAQNCLLKTLEEPKGNSLLILVTEYPEILFPTILSRLQKIKFYPVKDYEIKNYLQIRGIKDKESEEIVKFCQGQPGKAIGLILNPEELEKQKKAVSDLIKISKLDLALRFQYVKDLSETPKILKETLEVWLRYFRDIFIAKNPSGFKNYSSSEFRNIIRTIQETNRLISTTNINPRLALEILMLEL